MHRQSLTALHNQTGAQVVSKQRSPAQMLLFITGHDTLDSMKYSIGHFGSAVQVVSAHSLLSTLACLLTAEWV